MTTKEFLANSGHLCVETDGLNYLIKRWKDEVVCLPDEDKYWDWEYWDSLFARRWIADVIDNCDDVSQEQLQEIERIDALFKQKTIEVPVCVVGATAKIKQECNYNKEHDWFFFRVPPERYPDWIDAWEECLPDAMNRV